jgi:hypothetical protein
MEDVTNTLPALAGSDLLAPDIDLDPEEFEDIVNDAVEITDSQEDDIAVENKDHSIEAKEITGTQLCDSETPAGRDSRLELQNSSQNIGESDSCEETVRAGAILPHTAVSFQQSFELCIRQAAAAEQPIILDDDDNDTAAYNHDDVVGVAESGDGPHKVDKFPCDVEVKDVEDLPLVTNNNSPMLDSGGSRDEAGSNLRDAIVVKMLEVVEDDVKTDHAESRVEKDEIEESPEEPSAVKE